MHALLQHLEAPKASLRILCAFVAMHMALEARSGIPAALPAQLPAVVDKLLHVLAIPACTVTQAGLVPAMRVYALLSRPAPNVISLLAVLMYYLDIPEASFRMLCDFVAMHTAIEASSGNAAALPAQLPAVIYKLLHVLAMPACTVTCAGATPAVGAPHTSLRACMSPVLLC